MDTAHVAIHWSTRILTELLKFDAAEAPHGLYGLRESRRLGERLPKLSHILWKSPFNLAAKVGADHKLSCLTDDRLSFVFENGEKAKIELLTYANTKVRLFGSSYRIDSRSELSRPALEIRDYLGKLYNTANVDRKGRRVDHGVLLIAHFTREKDAHEAIATSCDADYLKNHALGTTGRIWLDHHSRNFWSLIQIWYTNSAIVSK